MDANSEAQLAALRNTPGLLDAVTVLIKGVQQSEQPVQTFVAGSTNFSISLGEKAAIIEQLVLEKEEKTKNMKAQNACELILKNYTLYVDTALQQENTYCRDKDGVFVAVSDDDLGQAIKEIYRHMKDQEKNWNDRDIDATVDLLKRLVPKQNRGEKSRRFVFNPITNSFWDTKTGELLPDLPEGQSCFRRLFDNPINNATHSPITPDHGVAFEEGWTVEHNNILLEAYSAAYEDAQTNQFKDDMVLEDFDFIKGWAQDEHGEINHGRYMDMLMTYADVFMGGEKKPMGQVACIGGHGNGKSLFRGSHLTIVGTNNLMEITNSDIQRSQDVINDIRRGGLLNFPDEEDTNEDGMGSAAQRVFKNMGDHKTVSSIAKYSGNKVSAAFDVTDIHTYNALPTFKGRGAGACIDRVRPIFFQHNFRADNQGRNGVYQVEKVIFTREAIAKLVGEAMGYARYCIETETWPESQEMLSHRSAMMDDTDPIEEFAEEFNKYFCGIESWSILAEEAVLWCADNGKDLDQKNLKSVLKMYFPQYSTSKSGKDIRKKVSITTYLGGIEYIKILGGGYSRSDKRSVLSKKNSLEAPPNPNDPSIKRKSIDFIHNNEHQSAVTYIEANGLANKYLQQQLNLDTDDA